MMFVLKKGYKYTLKGRGGKGNVTIPMEDRAVPAQIFELYEETPFSDTIAVQGECNGE